MAGVGCCPLAQHSRRPRQALGSPQAPKPLEPHHSGPPNRKPPEMGARTFPKGLAWNTRGREQRKEGEAGLAPPSPDTGPQASRLPPFPAGLVRAQSQADWAIRDPLGTNQPCAFAFGPLEAPLK